jgi:hypothetical protein
MPPNVHTILGPNDYRIYYACIEYDNHTVPGRYLVPSPTLVLVHASLIAHFAQTQDEAAGFSSVFFFGYPCDLRGSF